MKGHKTRLSIGSSVYDEICELCGATDARGDDRLNQECPGAKHEAERNNEQHVDEEGEGWR